MMNKNIIHFSAWLCFSQDNWTGFNLTFKAPVGKLNDK